MSLAIENEVILILLCINYVCVWEMFASGFAGMHRHWKKKNIVHFNACRELGLGLARIK